MMQRYQALIDEQNARNAALEKTLNRNKLIIAEESGDGRESADETGDGTGEGRNAAGEGRKSEGEGKTDGKLSKSKQKDYERRIIAEARRRMAEKYGDDYTED
jgi:hypothetical protein